MLKKIEHKTRELLLQSRASFKMRGKCKNNCSLNIPKRVEFIIEYVRYK